MLMSRVFAKPQKASMYIRQILLEMDTIGISSLTLVAIISVFMGESLPFKQLIVLIVRWCHSTPLVLLHVRVSCWNLVQPLSA